MSEATTAVGGEVPLRDVERELARQMKVVQGEGEAPVQRVRMSNLVVYCDRPQIADAVKAQLPDIVAVHPARVLLLLAEPGAATSEIKAKVAVQVRHLSRSQQACSEGVLIHATGGAIDRLPFAVRSLVIGDLPMNLWWAAPTPPALEGVLLYELAEYAQQIMYDSIGWTDPTRGVAATASWLESVERTNAGQWRVASDLNWRRLKFWRRTVSQALDPASAPGAAESITYLMVEHGPHAVVQAWELVSWLAQRFGWKVRTGKVQPGVEINWVFDSPAGETRVRVRRLEEGNPEIYQVRLVCKVDGKPAAMKLVRESADRLAIVPEMTGGEPRTVNIPPLTPAELIGRQLSDRERDPVFRDSMAVAQVLAQSLLS